MIDNMLFKNIIKFDMRNDFLLFVCYFIII